jgi:hypothetical protein
MSICSEWEIPFQPPSRGRGHNVIDKTSPSERRGLSIQKVSFVGQKKEVDMNGYLEMRLRDAAEKRAKRIREFGSVKTRMDGYTEVQARLVCAAQKKYGDTDEFRAYLKEHGLNR